jgi:hypothetical protein
MKLENDFKKTSKNYNYQWQIHTWLTLTFDCWLTAINEKVWKPRNKIVANPATIQIPPLRLKIPKRINIDRPDPIPPKRVHIISQPAAIDIILTIPTLNLANEQNTTPQTTRRNQNYPRIPPEPTRPPDV